MRRSLRLVVGIFLVFSFIHLAADDKPDEASADAMVLKAAGAATDGLGLLAFFRKRTLDDAERARLSALVKQLDSRSFAERQKAELALLDAGPAALIYLRPARVGASLEFTRRLEKMIGALEKHADFTLLPSALRVLMALKAAETVEVLLAYVADAPDEGLQEDVCAAIAACGPKAERHLREAIADPWPARRQAVAMALARSADAEQRSAVRELLLDPEPRVRLAAARGLARAKDKDAVPVLIALLDEGEPSLAGQAEDVLARIAGEQSPPVPLDFKDRAARRPCGIAWSEWWSANRESADLGKLADEERGLNQTMICEVIGIGPDSIGRVWECDAQGKRRWEIGGLKSVADAQLLPNGRVLLAEFWGGKITERDRAGTMFWEYVTKDHPVGCQRLANGNTFIATSSEVLEVARDGKAVWSATQPGTLYCAQRLRNGHILCVHGSNRVAELDAQGKELWKLTVEGTSFWASIDVLPNGRYLLSKGSAGQVVEIDAKGKVYWTHALKNPNWATRLRNGNTLIASNEDKCVYEFDATGKEVWKQTMEGRPFRARRR